MNYTEMTSMISTLANDLSRIAPDGSWSTVVHFVDHGEPEEATDLLIASVVQLGVPVTRQQFGRVRALVDHFDYDPADEPNYRYLGDPRMLDRMTVVDEPPP